MAEKKNSFKNKIKRFFKKLKKKWKNSKKSTKVLIIIASVLVVLIIAGLCVVNHYFGLMDISGQKLTDDYVDEDPNTFETIYDINTATTLDELICSWYKNNGEKMYSKNVVNVLLMATDTRSTQTLDEGNSDTLMLVSINKETKKITLASFFRDSYTYANIAGKDYYTKITEIHAYGALADKNGGGPLATIKTIENDYKIKIDGYATINFSGFEKVVNALGGIDVPVTRAEANFLASGREGAPITPIYVSSGDSVHLDGNAALWFARIRKLDSDIERTRRQRLVIEAIINKVSTASISELNNAVTDFLPYISTNFSKTEIIKYGTTALKQGWAKFEISQLDIPNEECRSSGYVGTKWMWFVDYPLAAQQLQTALYGKTNIVLQTNRVTALDLKTTAKKAETTTQSVQTTTSQEVLSTKSAQTYTTTTEPSTQNTTAAEESTKNTEPSSVENTTNAEKTTKPENSTKSDTTEQ